ncbi:MAG TPA: LapA family protein, partial [Candidatus Deferrimicrobiaceae bacterium]
MRGVLLLIVALLLVVAVFALQNPGIIPVRFLQYSGDTSLLAVIAVSFGTGIVVGFLCGIPSSIR